MHAVLFEPPFPVQRIVGLGVVLLLAAVAAYLFAARELRPVQRIVLILLRALALAGVVVVLCRPMAVKPAAEPAEKPVLSVLLDGSASMNTRDEGGAPRVQAAAAALTRARSAFLSDLASRYEVRYYQFSDELRPATFEDLAGLQSVKGPKTDLATALLGAAQPGQDRKQAGILLISDGRDNAGGEVSRVAARLKSLKIPVWTAAVGALTETRDVTVTTHLNQNFSFAKQPAILRADVSQAGFRNAYARVQLLREDQLVSTRQVNLKEGVTRLEFPIQEDHKGLYKYTVAVDPLPGEADTANNRRSLFVPVVDQKPRVLVVEAEPYWDSRFLLRSLQADPNLEVSSVFQLSPEKSFAIQEKTAPTDRERKSVRTDFTLPRTREGLYQYDCLVFGRGMDAMLGAEELRLLRDYVAERGGSVVFARGKAYSGEHPEIAGLEPVVWDSQAVRDVRFELTPEGRMNPIFNFDGVRSPDTVIRELPSMVSVTRILKEKSLSVILARSRTNAQEIAVISYQRYGKGKVMSVGSAGLWRWAFMPEDRKADDEVYPLFWRQMVRWLIDESDFLPGRNVSLRTDRHDYNPGERIRFVLRARNIPEAQFRPRIVLREASGKSQVLSPSREEAAGGADLVYTAYYQPESEGEFEAVLAGDAAQGGDEKARFTVYSDSVETRLVAANRDLLAQIASVTGGSELALSQLAQWPDRVRRFEEASRDQLKAADIWDRLGVFSLLVALLALEWFLRRRSGLV